jgi:hypothetical protein
VMQVEEGTVDGDRRPKPAATLVDIPDDLFHDYILQNASCAFKANDFLRPLWLTSKKLSAIAGQHIEEIDLDDDKITRDVQRLNALDQATAFIHFASRFTSVRRLKYYTPSGSTRALSMFCSCALPYWKNLSSLCMVGGPVDRHEWLLLASINCPHLKTLALVTSLAEYGKVTGQLQQWFAARLEALKLTISKTSKETAAAGFSLELKDMNFLASLTLTIHVPAERKQNQRISLHLSGLPSLRHLAVLQQNPERQQSTEMEGAPKIWGMELSLEGVQVAHITSLAIYDLLLQIRLRELPIRFPALERLHLHSVDASYLRTNFQFINQLRKLKQVKLWPEPPPALLAEWAKVNPGIELSVEKPDW